MDGSHIFLSAVGGDDAVAHSSEQAFPANFGCLYGVLMGFNRLSTAQLCSSANPRCAPRLNRCPKGVQMQGQ